MNGKGLSEDMTAESIENVSNWSQNSYKQLVGGRRECIYAGDGEGESGSLVGKILRSWLPKLLRVGLGQVTDHASDARLRVMPRGCESKQPIEREVNLFFPSTNHTRERHNLFTQKHPIKIILGRNSLSTNSRSNHSPILSD
jgi:hypothetical protein